MSAPRRVGGRYRIDELLARGGMASVYRGHDERLDRAVAIKVMREELGTDATLLRRFKAEALRAASVNHPNLVAVYDVGTEDGVPYIVMELVRDGDLTAALNSQRPMPPERAARIGVEVATALEAAHAAGVIHRDIKPGNILLDPDGRARVTDFGIARATGEKSLTRTGAMLGSVDYFSPEQARGERVTAATDLYALGVVLYELLTGRRPFVGDSPYAVATARLRLPVPDPRRTNADVPEELAAIVRRAMARDPAERFGSAGEMRAALERWLAEGAEATAASGTAVLAAPPASDAAATDGGGSRRRRGVPAPALAVLALLAIGVAGWVGARVLADGELPADPIGVVIGSPGGEVAPATPSPAASITPTPSSSPSGSPATPSPEDARETPAPAAAATPEPATPTAASAPTPAPAVVALAQTPDDAVAAFYAFVVDADFDAAYALWSDRMKDTYPRQPNLDDRFADTASITFSELFVASQSSDSATVQANFTERYDGGGSRQFIGYWRLIRSGDTWLLDEPNY